MSGAGTTYHHGMDEGVNQDEDPDGRGHVSHTSPHAQHGTGVVVGLQGGAGLALGEDDEGIKDLVELAQVEDPAVVSQTLGPHATKLRAIRQAVDDSGVLGQAVPTAGSVVVVDGVSNARLAVKAAEAVDSAGHAVRAHGAVDAPAHATEHAPEGPGGVDSEEDVVEDNEDEEGAGLADSPWLLAVGEVVLGEKLGGDGVDGRDGQGHAGVEGGGKDVVGDVEGVHDGGGLGERRNGRGMVGGREVEELLLREGAEHAEVLHGGCRYGS